MDVRYLHLLVFISFLCAFVSCFLVESGWFHYQDYGPYGTLNTVSETKASGRFAFVSDIIASICFLVSVVSLYLRISSPQSPDILTPIICFACSFGSLFLLVGSLSYVLDFYLNFPRFHCAYDGCSGIDIKPQYGVFLGLIGGAIGVVVSRLLFTHQSKLGGTQIMPQRSNLIIVMGATLPTICAAIGAASSDEGWFYVSDGWATQGDWGNKKYTYEVGDDVWYTESLPNDLSGVGKTSIIICVLATAVCGVGLLIFLGSLMIIHSNILQKLAVLITFVGSCILLAAGIQFKVGFDEADYVGETHRDPKPYYTWYLAILGSICGMVLPISGLLMKRFEDETENNHSRLLPEPVVE